MTTFTDKELIKEIKERIGSLDVRDNIERRAYEIALASLEAEAPNLPGGFTIEEAKELEALLIDGGLVELPGRTHYAYLEALPQVIKILHNFL